MDRNTADGDMLSNVVVALRKESVDRNNLICIQNAIKLFVALRKESVDRNKALKRLYV